jgi:hypothetical protein
VVIGVGVHHQAYAKIYREILFCGGGGGGGDDDSDAIIFILGIK